MYELIGQNGADRIIEILNTTPLPKNICIEMGKYVLDFSGVSETKPTEHFDSEMSETYLLNEFGEMDVIKCKDKRYNAFYNIGEWGYETRLYHTHIALGSSKFHDYCLQIELSQAVHDQKYIYIIKNVTNMAGQGAICRLYRGLKDNRSEKLHRQTLFIQRSGKEIIDYNKKDWIVLSKIRLDELYNDDNKAEIFYNLVYNMFQTMLLVESISDIS